MKLGIIDYYLDEYHANHYPAWIKEASKNEIQVACAYAKIDSPIGGMTTKEWHEKYKIPIVDSMEELIEKSDGIIVFSPDNPEQHEELCKLPFKSGKRVYVDKTFSETKKIAEDLFALAKKHNTLCYSASALRFAAEYKDIDPSTVENIASTGPGPLDQYSVHQLEPVVLLMGANISRVKYIGTQKWPAYICEYDDGRQTVISHHGDGCPFGMTVDFKDGTCKVLTVESDFYSHLIREMVDFFITGEIKAPHEQTIAIMAAREAAIKASREPGIWVAL